MATEYRKFGRTGLKVSPLCMGTMQFGWSLNEADTHKILSATFDAGINTFDTADIYSKWWRETPAVYLRRTLEMAEAKLKFRATGLFWRPRCAAKWGKGPNDEGLSRVHIMNAVEESLRRHKIDYIDLYQAHWTDEATPIEETMRAFDDLVKQGKVRYVGASNYAAWELMQALWTSDSLSLARYDSLQPHYNLIHRDEFERELRDVCKAYQIAVIPYSPLAGGFLTGKYRKSEPLPESKRAEGRKRAMTEKNFALIDEMEVIALRHKATIAQIALAWMLAGIVITSPIIGATSVEQLNDNLSALDVKLGEDEMALLNKMTAWKDNEE